jgi:hypothetical protein
MYLWLQRCMQGSFFSTAAQVYKVAKAWEGLPSAQHVCTYARKQPSVTMSEQPSSPLPAASAQVYKVAKAWEGLPSAEQLAQLSDRLRLQRQKRRVREEAAAAGAPVPPPSTAAAGSGDAAAFPLELAAAAAEADDDDDDAAVVEVTAELGAEQVLRLRREAAARAGMLIDLSKDAPEDELEAANR